MPSHHPESRLSLNQPYKASSRQRNVKPVWKFLSLVAILLPPYATAGLQCLLMETPKITVAIIGGGIAGLTTAIALSRLDQKDNIKIDIYEGAGAFAEIGAGVSVMRRPWSILKKLGLAEDLGKIYEAAILDEPRKSKKPIAYFQAKRIDRVDIKFSKV